MATDNFNDCLAFTLKEEGGYSNNPHDKGGATNFGVIQREYNSYRRLKNEQPQSVKAITQDEVADIYRTQYWDKVWGDKLPAGIDLSVFDFAVNSGPAQAIKELQLSINQFAKRSLVVDGNIGPATLDALGDIEDIQGLIKVYDPGRLSFDRHLSDWKYFGAGWGARCQRVETESLKMASEQPQVASTKPEVTEDLGMAGDAPKPLPSPGETLSIGAILTAATAGIAGQLSNVFGLIALVAVLGLAFYVWRRRA